MTQQKDGKKPERKGLLNPPPPQAVAKALGVSSLTIEWLAGDGSDRCYYRIFSSEFVSNSGHASSAKNTLVLMQLSGNDAVLLKEDGYDWINIGETLRKHGIFVPRVIATMPDHAALVIEDYGDLMLETKVYDLAENYGAEHVHQLFVKAFQVISKVIGIPRENSAAGCRRAFDADRFAWELRFFMQKYALPIAGISLTPSEQKAFDDETVRISNVLAAESQYFVHRDFHSRNIMVLSDSIAVIDFQDARLGPAAYDLVSLCFDSYVPFTTKTRREFLMEAIDIIRCDHGTKISSSIENLWKPMLLQRQLKAIGSFGYLTLEKGRGDYLKYVEGALRTLEEQGLEDERWPFLSSVLIRRLRDYLDQGRTHASNI